LTSRKVPVRLNYLFYHLKKGGLYIMEKKVLVPVAQGIEEIVD
jgi:hypothetical protein